MPPFFQSQTGKLVIGGCGMQIGLLAAFGSLVVLVVVCGVCLLLNVAMVGLVGGDITQSAVTATPVLAVAVESDPLLTRIDTLLGQVTLLEAEAAIPLLPPPDGHPFARVDDANTPLRSGPGFEFTQVGLLPYGGRLEITGRNSNSSWWLVTASNGVTAWVPGSEVSAFELNEAIPVINVEADAQLAASFIAANTTPTPEPTVTLTPTPAPPPGSPTPAATLAVDQYRVPALDTVGYKAIIKHLMFPPVSRSYSPDGSQIAITERIKVYTMPSAGGAGHVWLEQDEKMGPLGGMVWSPDGRLIAFTVGFKHKYCKPCRAVAILNVEHETITLLSPPEEHLETDMPRWLQDGRLMVNAHPGEPADGVTYVYDLRGNFEPAQGVYLLGSSHEGQQWYPWQPGRTWRAGVSERADSYNAD